MKKTIREIIIPIIIIAIVIIGIYFLQKMIQSDDQTQLPPEEVGFEEIEPEILPVAIEDDPLCTAEPIPSMIGSDIYPIDPQYIGLNFLGQLFTADKCGRVNNIWGVNGNDYTLGSTIWLFENPDSLLVDTFESVGFKCIDGNLNESCKYWRLKETVKVDDLLKLEPYSNNFEKDDCVNCG